MIEQIKQILNPPVLRRLDRSLLTTRPWLWSTKIHYLAYYAMPVYVLVTIGMLVMFRQLHKINSLVTALSILMGLELVASFFYMERVGPYFSIDPFGRTREWQKGLSEMLASLLCISIIFSGSILGLVVMRNSLDIEAIRTGPSTVFQTEDVIGLEDMSEFSKDECEDALMTYGAIPNVDFGLLQAYSGSTVRSTNDATNAYCTALDNAVTLSSFAYDEQSGFRAAFDFVHIILIGALGWLAFSNLNSPLPISATISFVFVSYFMLIFLAALFARLVPSMYEQNQGVLLFSTAVFGVITAGSILLIIRFPKRGSLSVPRAGIVGVTIATFPINLFLLIFVVMAPLAVHFRTISSYAATCFLIALALAPYLRDRLMILLALPRD